MILTVYLSQRWCCFPRAIFDIHYQFRKTDGRCKSMTWFAITIVQVSFPFLILIFLLIFVRSKYIDVFSLGRTLTSHKTHGPRGSTEDLAELGIAPDSRRCLDGDNLEWSSSGIGVTAILINT